jgi:hypothetical protein
MLASEELSWYARTSWPASRITLGSVGFPDNCNACSTDQPSVNLAPGAGWVVQPVDGEAETELL